jgi:hypothetical protein
MKLNAVGKPYGANYDPNYRLKYKPSYGHLRYPYPFTMRFVGDPPNYDANLRCFGGDPWWTAIMARAEERETQRRKRRRLTPEEKAEVFEWKQNPRSGEFTRRLPGGGQLILSPVLSGWSVDYFKKRERKRQQLGFVLTIYQAITQADAIAARLVNGGAP